MARCVLVARLDSSPFSRDRLPVEFESPAGLNRSWPAVISMPLPVVDLRSRIAVSWSPVGVSRCRAISGRCAPGGRRSPWPARWRSVYGRWWGYRWLVGVYHCSSGVSVRLWSIFANSYSFGLLIDYKSRQPVAFAAWSLRGNR